MTAYVRAGIRLGKAKLLGLVQSPFIGPTLCGHLIENVVGGAVDDTQNFVDSVSGQGFPQSINHGNRPGHRGFKIQIRICAGGGLIELRAVLCEDRFVAGHHRFACFQGFQHGTASRFQASHQLDDQVGGVNHRINIGGQQISVQALPSLAGVADRNAAKHQVCSRPCREFLLLVVQNARDLQSYRASTEQSNFYVLFLRHLCFPFRCPSIRSLYQQGGCLKIRGTAGQNEPASHPQFPAPKATL